MNSSTLSGTTHHSQQLHDRRRGICTSPEPILDTVDAPLHCLILLSHLQPRVEDTQCFYRRTVAPAVSWCCNQVVDFVVPLPVKGQSETHDVRHGVSGGRGGCGLVESCWRVSQSEAKRRRLRMIPSTVSRALDAKGAFTFTLAFDRDDGVTNITTRLVSTIVVLHSDADVRSTQSSSIGVLARGYGSSRKVTASSLGSSQVLMTSSVRIRFCILGVASKIDGVPQTWCWKT